jgi:hypothetical protein
MAKVTAAEEKAVLDILKTRTLSQSKNDTERGLDELFARLNSLSPTPSAYLTPKSTAKQTPEGGPDKSVFMFDSNTTLLTPTPATKLKPNAEDEVRSTPVNKVNAQKLEVSTKIAMHEATGNAEHKYSAKALEYVLAVPADVHSPAALIKEAASKLHQIAAPDTKDFDKNMSGFVESAVTYFNSRHNSGTELVKSEDILTLLHDSKGNLITFIVKLVMVELLALDGLEDVTALCKAVLPALLEAASTGSSDTVSNDSKITVGAWPSQQKRENGKFPMC